MKKASLVCFVLAIIVFVSCSVFDSDSNTVDSRIIGNWQLIRTSGGFIGEVQTPDSAGFKANLLEFTSNHTYSISFDDSIIKHGSYSLTEKDGEFYVTYIQTDDGYFPNKYASFESNDILILNDECTDCYTSTYKRIK